MIKPLATIQQEIRNLSAEERREVLQTLLAELDGPPDEDADEAWLAEAGKRLVEIDEAGAPCIPDEEVFTELDRILAK